MGRAARDSVQVFDMALRHVDVSLACAERPGFLGRFDDGGSRACCEWISAGDDHALWAGQPR